MEVILVFIDWSNGPYSFYSFRPRMSIQKIVQKRLSLDNRPVVFKFNFANFEVKHHKEVLEYFFGDYIEWMDVKKGKFMGRVPQKIGEEDKKFICEVFYGLGLKDYARPVVKMLDGWKKREKNKKIL